MNMHGGRAKHESKMGISASFFVVFASWLVTVLERMESVTAQEGDHFQCPFGGGMVAKTEANKSVFSKYHS
jgi:hypothetical protein